MSPSGSVTVAPRIPRASAGGGCGAATRGSRRPPPEHRTTVRMNAGPRRGPAPATRTASDFGRRRFRPHPVGGLFNRRRLGIERQRRHAVRPAPLPARSRTPFLKPSHPRDLIRNFMRFLCLLLVVAKLVEHAHDRLRRREHVGRPAGTRAAALPTVHIVAVPPPAAHAEARTCAAVFFLHDRAPADVVNRRERVVRRCNPRRRS